LGGADLERDAAHVGERDLDLGQLAVDLALQHLQHVKAGRRAHRPDDAAHGRALGALDEQLGVFVQRVQAQHAAVAAAVVGVGVFGRQLGEVLARARLLGRLIRALLQPGDVVGAGVLGHLDQDHGQVELGHRRARAGLLADVGVDVGVAHADARLDLALAQARQQHLVAHVGLEVLDRDALLLDALVQFGHGGQVVLAGNGQLGLRQGGVVHAQTQFARVLQLGALGDQALEHLLAQAGGGRRHHAALAHLAQGPRHARAHLVVGDGLGVDHGDDVVGRAGGRRGGCRCSGHGGRSSCRRGRRPGGRLGLGFGLDGRRLGLGRLAGPLGRALAVGGGGLGLRRRGQARQHGHGGPGQEVSMQEGLIHSR